MTNKQTEARIEKLYRECRLDLTNSEWAIFRMIMDFKRHGTTQNEWEKKEYARLAPFQVVRVNIAGLNENTNIKTCFVITHPLQPTIPCSPKFRRHLEAFRFASWLNRLELSRGAKTIAELCSSEEQRKFNAPMDKYVKTLDKPTIEQKIERNRMFGRWGGNENDKAAISESTDSQKMKDIIDKV